MKSFKEKGSNYFEINKYKITIKQFNECYIKYNLVGEQNKKW